MYNDEKDSKLKGSKKINEDFEKKIFRLYHPELKTNLTNKELPPIKTPGKKSDAEIISLKPPAGNEDDLNQANNFADSETPIDNSDSWETPAKGKDAVADN